MISVALEPLASNTDTRASPPSGTPSTRTANPSAKAEAAEIPDANAAERSKEPVAPSKSSDPAKRSANPGSGQNQPPDSQVATADQAKGATAPELLSMLLGQIRRCWVPPPGPPSPTILHVELFLSLDGSVAQPPQLLAVADDPYFRASADAARRAIYACAPYHLPADRFSEWHVIGDIAVDANLMSGR